jgi:hypothetical protein
MTHQKTTPLQRPGCAPMRLAALIGCVAVLAGTPALAAASAAERALQACRAKADSAQRLACYDAIVLTPAAAPNAPAGASTATAATATTAGSAEAAEFGLPARAETVTRIESQIDGLVEGWGPRTQFKFANGQVWEVEDGSSATLYLRSPKVTVRRGFAGAFYLVFEGSNRSPRVHRVR